MVQKTAALMVLAKVRFVSNTGIDMTVKMASWRSGGVRSAVDAGVPEATIRELGRWRSTAWLSYLLHSPGDLQGAARSMWGVQLVGSVETGLRVAACDVAGAFVLEDDRHVEADDVRIVAEVRAATSGILGWRRHACDSLVIHM